MSGGISESPAAGIGKLLMDHAAAYRSVFVTSFEVKKTDLSSVICSTCWRRPFAQFLFVAWRTKPWL